MRIGTNAGPLTDAAFYAIQHCIANWDFSVEQEMTPLNSQWPTKLEN